MNYAIQEIKSAAINLENSINILNTNGKRAHDTYKIYSKIECMIHKKENDLLKDLTELIKIKDHFLKFKDAAQATQR